MSRHSVVDIALYPAKLQKSKLQKSKLQK